MKKNTLLGICGFILFTSYPVLSQVSLPYFSGFDDANQQNGWIEYRIASTEFSHWQYEDGVGYSAPKSVGHDYSPSTGITLTDNWFVSPAFLITNGGQLDSIRYKFSGFSTPVAGDTVGVYLLNGSQDPLLATSKILLFDFRGTEYLPDNEYRVKTNINLQPLNGLSYIAIRYRNTDCSSKWLSVSFDNVAISGETIGLNEIINNQNELEIYPNPATGNFIVNSQDEIQSVSIQNEKGQIIEELFFTVGIHTAKLDLSNKEKGVYFIKINHGEQIFTKKIMVK